MAQDECTEFAARVEPIEPQPAETRIKRDDRVLGLRPAYVEHAYRTIKRLEDDMARDRKRQLKAERRMLLDMIELADRFEKGLKMFAVDSNLQEQKQAQELLESFYEILLEKLEERRAHRIPIEDIEGKGYKEVEFEGIPIEHPWAVASAENGADKVTKVLLSLWIQIRKDGTAEVIRKAKVNY